MINARSNSLAVVAQREYRPLPSLLFSAFPFLVQVALLASFWAWCKTLMLLLPLLFAPHCRVETFGGELAA